MIVNRSCRLNGEEEDTPRDAIPEKKMLRVGLTGGLNSGKSTVARMLRASGAEVIEADALGRAMMQPGQQVFSAIVERFGKQVLSADGNLNRARLAELAFRQGRLQDLNALVHPAVIEAQRKWMQEILQRNAAAIAVVESALIFEVERDALARGEREGLLAEWRNRFDRIVVVTAPDEAKIARFVEQARQAGVDCEAAEADARARLALQIPDLEKAARGDFTIVNDRDTTALRAQVQALWQRLVEENEKRGFSAGAADSPQ